jgi:hypothetical protein
MQLLVDLATARHSMSTHSMYEKSKEQSMQLPVAHAALRACPQYACRLSTTAHAAHTACLLHIHFLLPALLLRQADGPAHGAGAS